MRRREDPAGDVRGDVVKAKAGLQLAASNSNDETARKRAAWEFMGDGDGWKQFGGLLSDLLQLDKEILTDALHWLLLLILVLIEWIGEKLYSTS